MGRDEIKEGTLVQWWTPNGGWQFGYFNKVITKGRHKGKAEVFQYGKLLPRTTRRVKTDRITEWKKK